MTLNCLSNSREIHHDPLAQHARALIALAARLRVCSAVETLPFSDYVYNGRSEGGVYEGEQFVTDDYYIVVAKRVRNNVKG